jgi:hypothetical protein
LIGMQVRLVGIYAATLGVAFAAEASDDDSS